MTPIDEKGDKDQLRQFSHVQIKVTISTNEESR